MRAKHAHGGDSELMIMRRATWMLRSFIARSMQRKPTFARKPRPARPVSISGEDPSPESADILAMAG